MLKLFLVILFLISPTQSYARKLIRVGVYEFAPYYDFIRSRHQGVTVETVRILNAIQKDYNFELQRLPAKQRYQSFLRNRVDLFLFEDPAWEWSKYPYEFIPLDVEDGEVYVTKKGGVASPQNFEDLKKMKIAIVRGFHYGFAGLDADERALKKNFRVELADDSEGCLFMVTSGLVDVTVVAKSFIYDRLKKDPSYRDKVVISNNYDSIYKLGVVFNPKGNVSREKLESLIEVLKRRPDFQKLVSERFHY